MTTLWIILGAAGGAGGYYAFDRVTFPWGSNVREMRHAGWRARKKRA
jgi:hypothetical protein